jgi:hypothetical protein
VSKENEALRGSAVLRRGRQELAVNRWRLPGGKRYLFQLGNPRGFRVTLVNCRDSRRLGNDICRLVPDFLHAIAG